MKAVLLLSGGIDSATALYKCLNEGMDVYALTFSYELVQSRDLEAAVETARLAQVKHFVVDVNFYKSLKGSPSSSEERIVDVESGVSKAYVPGRNIVFFGIAAAYAETLGAEVIVTGHNKEDSERFPDASSDFFEIFDEVLRKGLKTGSNVKILAPFINLSKHEVLSKALDLHVPLGSTWSCYNDGEEPCEVCYGCRARNKSFKTLRVKDPCEPTTTV